MNDEPLEWSSDGWPDIADQPYGNFKGDYSFWHETHTYDTLEAANEAAAQYIEGDMTPTSYATAGDIVHVEVNYHEEGWRIDENGNDYWDQEGWDVEIDLYVEY